MYYQKLKEVSTLYKDCLRSDSNFIIVYAKYLYYRIFSKKRLYLHEKVSIKGVNNIEARGRIRIGVDYVGFLHKTDVTYLNINGKLKIDGNYSIGRGCRFDIGQNAEVKIGNGGYINANTNLIIMHKLTIGENCVISWNCQFLDEDFHSIEYAGKKASRNEIILGNNVWVGCGVYIYKGTVIADGCVVASNSVVRGEFNIKNAIIGGNPARVIKENIDWH